MRIATLTQSYPPMISGAAISAQQTAESLVARGHQVLVIAASEREYPYHIYRDNFTILRLRSIKNPMRVGQRMLAFPRTATMNALRRFRPDIIHVHEPIQMGPLALAYARRAQIPVVFTAHQLPWFVASYFPNPFKPLVEKILWMYARWVLGRYSSIITPTQTIAEVVKRMTGLTPKVVSNGLDLQTFHPPLSSDDRSASRQKWNLPPRVPLLLHTGRLDPDKSVDQVIRGAAQPIRESEAHLAIVGDGCEKQTLIQLCKDLGIEHRVHFLGFVSVEDGLPEIYRMADVFVTASEIETQGLVLLEAAASGLPIVAVDATCIPEIVHDHVTGFLAEPGDIDTLSNAIIALMNNPKWARTMGREGHILAEEHDLHTACTLHEKLYRDAIKQTHTRHTFDGRKLLVQWKLMKSLIGIK